MAPVAGMRQDGHNLSPELVYKPDGVLPYIDIVLVPGLGRKSRETWTVGELPSCFWPDWLRDRGPLRMARVWMASEDCAVYYHLNLFDRPVETIVAEVEAFQRTLAHDVGSKQSLFCCVDVRLIISWAECLGRNTDTRRLRSPFVGRHRGQAGKRTLCALNVVGA